MIAHAQQRPPTVSNLSANDLRMPSNDEVGLWQLLSHSNDPRNICGAGKSLAVVRGTGKVVCYVPAPDDCESMGGTPATVSRGNAAAARQKLSAALRELSRLQSMLDRGVGALNTAIRNLEQAKARADALQRRANATQDVQSKLSLLREQLDIKKSMMAVVRQQDKLQGTVSDLEAQLGQAQHRVASARQSLAEVGNSANRNTRRTECPTNERQKTPVQMALEREMLNYYGGNRNEIRTVAEHADYASLAKAAYNVGVEPDLSDWKRVNANVPYASLFFGSNTASFYQNSKTGEIVVAFQGTDGPGDVNTDVSPYSGQSRWARNLARSLVERYPNYNITFVGHSLGGRLARLARIETGRKAVVFDSAPLLDPLAIAKEKVLTKAAEGASPLMGFRAPGDGISLQTRRQDIEVKNYVHDNIAQAHSIEQLATAMQTVKQVESWMKN